MGRAVLIYDGDCAVCRASALWLMRLALETGRLEILPGRSDARRARFPQISEESTAQAMQLVRPDGRVLSGADAVPEILRAIRGLGWTVAFFELPGARRLARRVYGWIATSRMRLSCGRPRAG